jgi:hypothetical protein
MIECPVHEAYPPTFLKEKGGLMRIVTSFPTMELIAIGVQKPNFCYV